MDTARPDTAVAAHVDDIDEVLEKRRGDGAGKDKVLKRKQQDE